MAGTEQFIEAKLLIVDPHVQRTLDERRVNEIIGDFNQLGMGVVTVSERLDGSYHVVDGQHRVAALLSMDRGTDNVRCLVYTGLSLAEEAALFRRLNNTRIVNSLDKFRIRVVEGDPAAVSLNTMLESLGWRAAPGVKNSFTAVAALEKIYKGPSGDAADLPLVRQVMGIVTKAWGIEPIGTAADILRGLGAVLRHYGELVDENKLVGELSGYQGGPRRLVGAARGLRELRGGRMEDSLAEILVTLLNNKRRNKLQPWRS